MRLIVRISHVWYKKYITVKYAFYSKKLSASLANPRYVDSKPM